MIVKNIESYQPRFQAFLQENGIVTGQEVQMYEFMAWIPRKLKAFKSLNHITTSLSTKEHEQFTAWLLQEATKEGQLVLFESA